MSGPEIENPEPDSRPGSHGTSASAQCDEPASIRIAAMNLLARREHSLQELRRKLSRRFEDAALVDQELLRLAQENLQSDERYAQSYVRRRAGRGYGPLRIRQEMRERGLQDSEIACAFEALAPNWFDLAAAAYQKKFGTVPVQEPKDKARRIRFLQYRGFASEHFQHLLDD